MKKRILIFYFTALHLLSSAQSEGFSVSSRINDSIKTIALDTLWKFNSGDDTAWAQPTYNDVNWKSSSTTLNQRDLSKINFSGIGWFRLHINIPKEFNHKPLALILSQSGASEFFIDGISIHSFGHPDKESSKEIKYTSNGIPYIFEFGDGQSHLIAVRYSCHIEAGQKKKIGGSSSGFSASIREPEDAINSVIITNTVISIFTTFLSTFFFTLGFLHFLLFLFYRNQVSNLFYSIFISLFGLFFLLPLIISNVSDPSKQDNLSVFLLYIIPVFFTALLGFIYSLFYSPVPKRFRIISAIMVVLLVLEISGVDLGILIFSFVCGVTIISAIEVFKAIYKKKKGAWVVGSATMSFLLMIIILLAKNALGFGNGIYVDHFDVKGMALITLLLTILLSIPVSMSVYLAREFAGTNKSLEKKLIEVETLSERTIEQEKEKQKILENQKDVLETQVKERTHEVVEQKKLIEEKNKDITDSINYAKRIQEAILPEQNLLSTLFSDSFVLFQPKDIVSGDFYWFAEHSNKKIIAVADCTGHGVPGALMSMIGSNILNKLVVENGITQPDIILNMLNDEIRTALKQKENNSETRDGMDILLISIEGRTLEYAGAQRPLWIISDNKISETKADKFPIGGIQQEQKRVFTKHILTLQKDDTLYLSSDGFADQFGGENGKKLMTKNFKELLISVQSKPMSEQKEFLKTTIETWKGSREQVDDILVIGIKI